MNVSLSKFNIVLLAFAFTFVACQSDKTSANSNLPTGTVKQTSNPLADAPEAITGKSDEMETKSDELLEIYVSPEAKNDAEAKEVALASIDRKKAAAKAVEKEVERPVERSREPVTISEPTPVKKAVVNNTPPVAQADPDEEPPLKPTKIRFDNKVHEYGMIMQGDKVTHKFTFTNTGSEDLVISDVSASCGCTKPSYPFIPIGPGEKGYIGVNFDSKGKLGRQKPSVTVVSNAGTNKLYLEGFVDAERAKQPEANAPKVEIIDDSEMEKLKEEAIKSAPKTEEGGK